MTSPLCPFYLRDYGIVLLLRLPLRWPAQHRRSPDCLSQAVLEDHERPDLRLSDSGGLRLRRGCGYALYRLDYKWQKLALYSSKQDHDKAYRGFDNEIESGRGSRERKQRTLAETGFARTLPRPFGLSGKRFNQVLMAHKRVFPARTVILLGGKGGFLRKKLFYPECGRMNVRLYSVSRKEDQSSLLSRLR